VFPEIYSSDYLLIMTKIILDKQIKNTQVNLDRIKKISIGHYTDLLEEDTKIMINCSIQNIEEATQTFTDLIIDIAMKTIGINN